MKVKIIWEIIAFFWQIQIQKEVWTSQLSIINTLEYNPMSTVYFLFAARGSCNTSMAMFYFKKIPEKISKKQNEPCKWRGYH